MEEIGDLIPDTSTVTVSKKRYFIHLAYDGTNYAGWQFQPKAISVQQVIEEGLSKICNRKMTIVGCGRTDAGVHADNYYAHFDTEIELPQSLLFKLNNVLPNAIKIFDIYEVELSKHARYSAIERAYVYYLHTRKDPFLLRFSTEFRFFSFDYSLLQSCASLLHNYNDFKPLSKHNPDNKTTLCQIRHIEWIQTSEYTFEFHISANRFLHNMVRRIVATSLAVGRGKMNLEQVKYAMDTQTELPHIAVAPPQGLHLYNVIY